MSHTVRGKAPLLARVKKIQGQFRALETAIEQERGCAEVLNLIAAVRGATNGLMAEVFEEHLKTHALSADAAGVDELMTVVRSYLK